MTQDFELIWKYDENGDKRPLQEQLDRRKADLEIAFLHVSWYEKNPLKKDPIQRVAAHNKSLNHMSNINKDIARLERKLNIKSPTV